MILGYVGNGHLLPGRLNFIAKGTSCQCTKKGKLPTSQSSISCKILGHIVQSKALLFWQKQHSLLNVHKTQFIQTIHLRCKDEGSLNTFNKVKKWVTMHWFYVGYGTSPVNQIPLFTVRIGIRALGIYKTPPHWNGSQMVDQWVFIKSMMGCICSNIQFMHKVLDYMYISLPRGTCSVSHTESN